MRPGRVVTTRRHGFQVEALKRRRCVERRASQKALNPPPLTKRLLLAPLHLSQNRLLKTSPSYFTHKLTEAYYQMLT